MNGLSSRSPARGFVWGCARRWLVQCAAARRVPPRLAGSWAGSLPAWGVLWARARRVSARLPSNFHLLAQMKVTKAKGLEHQPFDLFASATRLLPRLWHENTHRTTLSVTSLTFSRSSSFRLDPAGPRRGRVPKWSQKQPAASQRPRRSLSPPTLSSPQWHYLWGVLGSPPVAAARRPNGLVLGPFALVTFIWASK